MWSTFTSWKCWGLYNSAHIFSRQSILRLVYGGTAPLAPRRRPDHHFPLSCPSRCLVWVFSSSPPILFATCHPHPGPTSLSSALISHNIEILNRCVERYRSRLNSGRTLWVFPWCGHWPACCANVVAEIAIKAIPTLPSPPSTTHFLSLSDVVRYFLLPPPPIWFHPGLLGMSFFVAPHVSILNVWVSEGSNN